MNLMEIQDSYKNINGHLPEGMSFGIVKGHVPNVPEVNVRGVQAQGWLRIVNAEPEAYFGLNNQLRSGLQAANVSIDVAFSHPIVFDSLNNRKHNRDFVNATAFWGHIASVNGVKVPSAGVQGIQIESRHAAGILRVAGDIDSMNICTEAFELSREELEEAALIRQRMASPIGTDLGLEDVAREFGYTIEHLEHPCGDI